MEPAQASEPLQWPTVKNLIWPVPTTDLFGVRQQNSIYLISAGARGADITRDIDQVALTEACLFIYRLLA